MTQDPTGRATRATRPPARELADLEAAEQEEAAGAGTERFTLLVTATVDTVDELEQADRLTASRASEARMVLRPTNGAQAAAYSAGIPAGGPAHPRHDPVLISIWRP